LGAGQEYIIFDVVERSIKAKGIQRFGNIITHSITLDNTAKMALSKAFLFSVLPLVAYATDASNRCLRCIVPISVTTSAISLNLKPFANSIESTQHLVDSTSQTNYSSSIIGSEKLINKTYDIAIEYCPAEGQPEKDIIQVLTHGAGFDRS
jgi:hypothetical protein